MKSIYLIIIPVLFCVNAVAKTPKADRLFERWDYFRAAKLYEKEAAKHPGADIYFKLGECYRKMNLYIQEQAAYDKVNATGIYKKPEFYLNYGQVLKTNGLNEQAKIAFNKYDELVPADQRGKFFSESIDIIASDHKWDEPVSMSSVASLNTKSADLCPVVYKDGIVFTSNRKTPGRDKIYGWTGANYLDLYYAKKGSNDLNYTNVAPFGGGKIIKKFNDGPACFTKNFDTIYISRVEKDLRGIKKKDLKIERNKIFISAIKNGKWTEAIPFPFNNDTFSIANPFITTDGSRIYFVSDMPGGYGETDIYYCNRENNGWSKPINMGPNINTFNREKYPLADAAGNFYFSSDGYQGLGGLDICVALNDHGAWTKAIPMKYPFNSSSDDFGIVFLKDGKTGYITSNRYLDGQGDDNILYFNLLRDKVDSDLVTSVYTIGYKPQLHEIIAAKPTIATQPLIVATSQPTDILIYFDLNKSGIRPDAITHIDSVIHYMNEYPDLTLSIGGHCDSRGTPAYNIDLSRHRSEAALHYLRDKGISTNRMLGKGYGSTQLANHCDKGVNCTDQEYQLSRRVDFHFERK